MSERVQARLFAFLINSLNKKILDRETKVWRDLFYFCWNINNVFWKPSVLFVLTNIHKILQKEPPYQPTSLIKNINQINGRGCIHITHQATIWQWKCGQPPALNTKRCFSPLKCEKYQNIRVFFQKSDPDPMLIEDEKIKIILAVSKPEGQYNTSILIHAWWCIISWSRFCMQNFCNVNPMSLYQILIINILFCWLET